MLLRLLVQEPLRHKRRLHIRWCCHMSCNRCRKMSRSLSRKSYRMMMHIRSLELVRKMSSLELLRSMMVLVCSRLALACST